MELDEVRFKRTQIQIQMAMMMNPEMPEDSEEELPNNTQEDTKTRKLKKT